MHSRKVPSFVLILPFLLAGIACVPPPGSGGPGVVVDERTPQEQICAGMIEADLADSLDEEARAAAQEILDAAVEGCMTELDSTFEKNKRQRARSIGCVLAATDAAGVAACAEPDPAAVCEHVLTVVMAELSAQLPEDQKDQLQEAFEQGKVECAEQGRRELEENRERYLLTADCFMQAETVAALQACDQVAGPPPEVEADFGGPAGGGEMPIEPPPEPFPDAPPPLDEKGYEDPEQAAPTPVEDAGSQEPPAPKAPKKPKPPVEPTDAP